MPYVELFEPVAKPRENIRIVPDNKYYRVEYVEPIYGILISLGSVSAESTGSLKELTELDLNPLEMGQWRIVLLDDINLIVKQPRATQKGTTKIESTKISPHLMLLDPSLKFTELFTFEDKTRIFIQPENPTKYSVNARILVFGWKFLLAELESPPAKYTDIPVATVTRAHE